MEELNIASVKVIKATLSLWIVHLSSYSVVASMFTMEERTIKNYSRDSLSHVDQLANNFIEKFERDNLLEQKNEMLFSRNSWEPQLMFNRSKWWGTFSSNSQEVQLIAWLMFNQAKIQSFVWSIQFNVLSIELGIRAILYFVFRTATLIPFKLNKDGMADYNLYFSDFSIKNTQRKIFLRLWKSSELLCL